MRTYLVGTDNSQAAGSGQIPLDRRRSAEGDTSVAPTWFILVLALLPALHASPAAAIKINLHELESLKPGFDSNLSKLRAILEAAASYWEGIILDTHEIDIGYRYQSGTGFFAKANVTGHDGVRPTMGHVDFNITVPGGWWFDDDPFDNSQFDMQQVLVRDLTPSQQTLFYSGSPPGLLEAGYWGDFIGPSPGLDAFTSALHELGHILGVTTQLPGSQAVIDSGTYQFHPDFINGATAGAKHFDVFPIQPEHLRSPHAMMHPGSGLGDRNLPSATDVFAAASVAGWNVIDLYRKDFLDGTVWELPQNWLGRRVPNGTEEVYIRHGGTVSLLLRGGAGDLTIRDGSGLTVTNDAVLTVERKLTVEGGPWPPFVGGDVAVLTVEPTGIVTAVHMEINEDGRVFVSDNTPPFTPVPPRIQAGRIDNNAGGLLSGHGLVRAEWISNDGTITALAGTTPNPLALSTGSAAGIHLSGQSGTGRVFAVLGHISIISPLAGPFTGQMTVGQTRHIQFLHPWQFGADGRDPSAPVPVLNLNGGVSLINPARIEEANMTAHRGQINVSGWGHINADVTFNSGISVDIAHNGFFVLNQATVFNGGTYTGAGTIRFNGPTQVNQDTTMNVRFVDLDGAMGETVVTLNNAKLTLHTDAIDFSDFGADPRFDGTMHINGLGARLDVRLNDPAASWQMNGVMNLTAIGLPGQADVLLAGSPLRVTGTINAAGSPWITADLDVRGGLTTAGAATRIGLVAGTHIIRSSATVTGPGTLENRPGSTLFLEDGVVLNVGLFNAGRLEPGPGIAGALIFGNFEQSFAGTLGIELAGTGRGDGHDQLRLQGLAMLAGGLELELVDGFVPQLYEDAFRIVQAGIIGTFDTVAGVLPLPGVALAVIYSPVAVDVVAALPGDANLDGRVDGEDFLIWQSSFGTQAGATWTGGDFNGDGRVDGEDFLIWQANFGSAVETTAVPEPAAALVVLGLAVLFLHRRRIVQFN